MAAVILILIAVFVISFFSESHGIGIWIALLITHASLVEMFGPTAVHLPAYCGAVVMAITIARGRWSGISAAAWLLAMLLASLMALAALAGAEPMSSIARFVAYAKVFVLAIFISGVIKNDNQVEVLSKYMIAAVCVGVVFAYYQDLTGSYGHVQYEGGRATGLAEDPNETAMLLLSGFPLTVYWFMRSSRVSSRILLVAISVGIIGAIALTQSRGGGVALLIVSIFLLLRRPSIKTFAVGVVVLAAALAVAPVTYFERMETVTELGDSDDSSLEYRLHFVELGAEVFIRNPVLGVGLGNFGRAISEFDPKFSVGTAAHNMYLEFFVENGLFAGLLFLTILAFAWLTFMRFGNSVLNEPRSYDLGFCFAMSLIGVLCSALFLSVGSRPIIWILVGIAGAFSKIVVRSKANEQSWPRGP